MRSTGDHCNYLYCGSISVWKMDGFLMIHNSPVVMDYLHAHISLELSVVAFVVCDSLFVATKEVTAFWNSSGSPGDSFPLYTFCTWSAHGQFQKA